MTPQSKVWWRQNLKWVLLFLILAELLGLWVHFQTITIEILFRLVEVSAIVYTAIWLVKYTKATQDILIETVESNELLKEQLNQMNY
jgi:hypothetical protein